ncbi:hypothetical protein JQ561_03890 [Bradyrhizobium diazoefficiens]|nr:hypothetical protein [Bradyrhizobium diazoefficiens]MBR0925737.1 hypothetical protein [Bradyrhizobium diazoefficiens]
MKDKSQQQMLNNYRLLMEEVKQRTAWLNFLLDGKLELPNPAIQEFGFLQLRIICELIALGCLTAHGDLPEVNSRRLQDEWNATNILKRLEHLHPDFYPKPIVVTTLAPGRKHVDFVGSGFLARPELVSLYGRSSNLIHRGSVSKLLQPKSPCSSDLHEIEEWTLKIMNLLRHHTIGHHGGQSHMFCLMENPHEGNCVQVAFATALDGTSTEDPPSTTGTILPGLHPSKPWGRA